MHDDIRAVVNGSARLVALAGAGGPAVVGVVGRPEAAAAAVVVAELDDDEVAGRERRFDGREAPLVGEGARAAAGEGAVDDGEGERVLEVVAPSYADLPVSVYISF